MPYKDASKDEYVKTLKNYCHWCWKDEKEGEQKYLKYLGWMKDFYKGSEKNAINHEKTLDIVSKEKNLRNKCLFMFLFDSGARIEEALNVRFKDLRQSGKQKYYMVHLRGTKTIESNREISIGLTTKYLNDWIKEHPKKEENEYIFPVNYDNARKIIRLMSKKVLGFALKPHELRHSSASHYVQIFGTGNLGGFYHRYGWKFGSKEARTYIKTNLYSGEASQDKIVSQIENNISQKLIESVNEYKEKTERQQIEIDKLRSAIDELKYFVSYINKLNKPIKYTKNQLLKMSNQGQYIEDLRIIEKLEKFRENKTNTSPQRNEND